MKKIIFLLPILILALLIAPINTLADSPLPNVSEDFEKYEEGKIEEIDSFLDLWTNEYFNGNQETSVAQCDVAAIEKEESGNKVLHINNIPNDGSFFYIGLKNKYKNFNATFRVKVLDAKDVAGGWFGINCRKENDARYNGTSGMLLTYRWFNESESIRPDTYRYLPGTQVYISPETAGDLGKAVDYLTYETYGDETITRDWITYKVSAIDSEYKLYANDTLVAHFTYDKKATNIFGYLSFNVCVTDLLFDDFYLENLDTEAPPKEPTFEPAPNDVTEVTKPDDKPIDEGNKDDQKKGCGSTISVSIVFALATSIFVFLGKRNEKN